tara:strand:+ start:508 stop:2289 length:1782 start_codon:yes stop_codon:yes gene_type:complete
MIMKYPKEYLNEIRVRLRVSQVVGKYVQLKKRGKEFIGLSPFKNERTPSFTVNDEKGFYHCFSTGEHGNIFDFLMKTQSIGFGEAVKTLAIEAGMPTFKFSKTDEKREKRFNIYKNIYKLYSEISIKNLLDKKNRSAIEYLQKRGITKNIIEEFKLGFVSAFNDNYDKLLKDFSEEEITATGLFYQNNKTNNFVDRFYSRVVFPINNLSSEIIAFGGRVIENKKIAKYINSPETEFYKKGKILFNLEKAKLERSKTDEVIIVEGYMDVLSLYKNGIKNVISNSGTAITENQIDLIWKIFSDPIICLDGDESGQIAAIRIAERLLYLISGDNKIYFSELPEGYDPDDFIRKNGIENFSKLIESKEMIQDYIWNVLIQKIDKNNPYEISKFEKKIRNLFVKIKDVTLKKYITDNLARKFSKLTPNLNTSNFKKRNFKNTQILSQTKSLYNQKNKFSEENFKELSFMFILVNFPFNLSRNKDKISEITLDNPEYEDLKKNMIDCVEKDEINFDKLEKIINSNSKLIDEIKINSNIKMIMKNRNEDEISEFLMEILDEIKKIKKTKKIKNLETKMINNFDDQSYSELIKLKTQLNTE